MVLIDMPNIICFHMLIIKIYLKFLKKIKEMDNEYQELKDPINIEFSKKNHLNFF